MKKEEWKVRNLYMIWGLSLDLMKGVIYLKAIPLREAQGDCRSFSFPACQKKNADWKFVEWNISVFLGTNQAAFFLVGGVYERFSWLEESVCTERPLIF